MPEMMNHTEKDVKLFESIKSLKQPIFSSTADALTYYQGSLEKLASKYNQTVQLLLETAENASAVNEDYQLAQSFSKRITFLSRL